MSTCGTGLANINNLNSVPTTTADPYTVAPEYNSGCTLGLTGHTEWVDRVVIHWPSGTQQVLTNPAVDQLHTVTEPHP